MHKQPSLQPVPLTRPARLHRVCVAFGPHRLRGHQRRDVVRLDPRDSDQLFETSRRKLPQPGDGVLVIRRLVGFGRLRKETRHLTSHDPARLAQQGMLDLVLFSVQVLEGTRLGGSGVARLDLFIRQEATE